MGRAANIYIKGRFAGVLKETDDAQYVFRYDDAYYVDSELPALSLTLPKTQQEYLSSYLFPVFFNMASEGDNRRIQSGILHIDEHDDFGILLATGHTDTIGAITLQEVSL